MFLIKRSKMRPSSTICVSNEADGFVGSATIGRRMSNFLAEAASRIAVLVYSCRNATWRLL